MPPFKPLNVSVLQKTVYAPLSLKKSIITLNLYTLHENAIKHRINSGDKANNAKDQTVASIYDNRFCIPLDFEILETSLPLYQYGLGSRLTYELTFADCSDVIKATDSYVCKTAKLIPKWAKLILTRKQGTYQGWSVK